MVAILETELSESSFAKDELEPSYKRQAAPLPREQAERHVRFSPNDRIFEIPHLNDISDDEVDDVWMSPEDFKAIQRECKAIVLMIQHKHSLLKNIEIRGLEHHTPSEKEETEGLQDLLYDTVDRLMTFVDDTSMDVSELLAEMCMKISACSEAKARQIALQDEENARA
mmetsp:Transcript_3017/g.7094  ORF Transcript_3017/g.7094 Transcript_3017/m.7094 type:complete len:169 (+) Transcript_3017:62-568(+)